jgi:hypothetical protein
MTKLEMELHATESVLQGSVLRCENLKDTVVSVAMGETAESLIPLLLQLDRIQYLAEKVRVETNKALTYLTRDYIPRDLQTRGLTGLNTPDSKLTLREDLSAKVINPEKLHQFLEEHGAGDVMKYTIHNATLKKVVKDFAEQGVLVPGDACEVAVHSYVHFTKG